MIPRRLRLHNFLSYRDCEVDLSGLRLAVLCGPNGHGKSAMLDAITWALWGEGRGRLEDDRIHLGEDEMLVDFEFEASGDTFQVVRKRTRGRGAGSLEFLQLTAQGRRTPLTGGTISETQAEIIRKLRMDYDTFVNSAFIAQGRANEFTRKRPAERKEVFRRVLGLERYQALADAATERRKEAVADLKDLERNAGEAADQVRQLPALESELCAVAAERESLKPDLARLDDAVVQFRQAAADHARLEREAREALERAESLRADITRREASLDGLEADLASARDVISRADDVRAAQARVAELRQQEAELADRQQEAARLEALIAGADQRISVENARLESERDARRKELEAAQAAAASLPALEREEADIAEERTAIATITRQSEDLERQANDHRAKAAAAGAEANEAARQNAELKEREAQLETVEAACPVCLRPLDPGDLDHV
ncbi:MAG TPA: SMC family ATPase, partial [Tepidiformaceae bacterium]|nr:SMC family ATPase [Tepidiformaceae bacterium]